MDGESEIPYRASFSALRNTTCKVAGFPDSWTNNGTCTTRLKDALNILNSSCEFIEIHYDDWERRIIELSIDAVESPMVYNIERAQHFSYTRITDINKATFYVKTRMAWRVNVVSWKAIKSIFTVTLASGGASFFCLFFINRCGGKNGLKDVGRVFVGMFSITLNFSPSYPHYVRSRLSGRILLAFWAFGAFLLSSYFQSLLTTSVGIGQKSDSDDTPEKLGPKLRARKVLVCADLGSYVGKMLSQCTAPSQFMQDLRSAIDYTTPSGEFIDPPDFCLGKVTEGTHVYVTYSRLEECRPGFREQFQHGKPRFDTQLATVIATRTSPIRRLFGSLVGRLVETGWLEGVCDLPVYSEFCYLDRKEPPVMFRLDSKLLALLCLAGFLAASLVLCLEILLAKSRR
ncbi:hypothetical protein HPB48_022077 [Haemaphysalis longicornis]|uniref:Ionotropic receptor n=1 Tax=Haemaphysalis longicornis TaxID=44386 RepID=A0A9J6FY82_HAELO|nr:hypothetical protein HPB48_022077 [Haemaphysalis longicornis]